MRWFNRSVATLNTISQLLEIYRRLFSINKFKIKKNNNKKLDKSFAKEDLNMEVIWV